MYKVIRPFTDLQDNNYLYKSGDSFPRKGLQVSNQRLLELSGINNRQGIPLIQKAEEPKKQVVGKEVEKKKRPKKTKEV